MSVKAQSVPATTSEQKRTLASLGLPPEKIRWTWRRDEAQKLIEERCAYLGINPPDGPLLLTAWQRAEVMLCSGYEVREMPQYLCYEVTGGKETYHVCLNPKAPHAGCSCPQGILKADKRQCKHTAAVMVQLYKWAEASDMGVAAYSRLFDALGITALRAGAAIAPQEVLL